MSRAARPSGTNRGRRARGPALRSHRRLSSFSALAAVATLAALQTGIATAQDWGSEDEDWGSSPTAPPPPASSGTLPVSDWSLRAGLGFVSDPNALLLAFELPYRFDRFVSAGPLIQVGLHDNKLIVAPTANLTISIPDLPGERFDRLRPHVFAGIGFAVIEKDERQGDNRSAGFLVNAGVGLDLVVSERFSIGSRMVFNFLPEQTLEENFFYAWEVGGLKLSF